MSNKIYDNQKDKKEIPTKRDPGHNTPEKAPNPDLDPREDNPINPRDDESRGMKQFN